ncbi:C-type lectin domain family 17, member A isoform X1 [Manis javanica]|uniref:C-type lectin domain family 17, member A isoform X1 n=1 Tax=Manis javanica TaxID=9974 RepID=UPI00187A2EBD|nr:C-type lectin domain family 17, member A isoform X1 [Manis javanica]KAI5935533.1 C-type lectin domain family 17, member A [Manis javanica]
MHMLYTNPGRWDLPGTREEEEEEDYENSAPPYKDLPPKPGWMAPPRPPKAGKKTENPPLPCKTPKIPGLDVTPATCRSPQQGAALEYPPFPPSAATTPVPWLSQKAEGPGCYQEERLMVYLCLLVVVSLLLGCTGLVVSLIKYQEVVEELRMLTFQQMAWRENVTGMAGLAGLKKDIDRVRADTNQSLVELRGLLDCARITCPEGWLSFEGKCYYFSQSPKSWYEARMFCQENYSHLVIISSFAEQNFVAKAHGSPRVYWLGLSDINREGDWRWLDGSPVTLSFWGPEEPNNIQDEDCASMDKGGTWNDLSCDKTTYWICERKCSC